jgi:hypothetical protein
LLVLLSLLNIAKIEHLKLNNLKGEMLMEKGVLRKVVERHLGALRDEMVELGLQGWFSFEYENEKEEPKISSSYQLIHHK